MPRLKKNLTWGCEHFCDYLIGKPFHMLTDHKPLVSLLSSKPLDSLPLRVQHFRMRLMRFTYTISHVPGKDLTVADTLSPHILQRTHYLIQQLMLMLI